MTQTLSFQEAVISANSKDKRKLVNHNFNEVVFDFPVSYEDAKKFANDDDNRYKGFSFEYICIVGYIINGLEHDGDKYYPVDPKNPNKLLSVKDVYEIGVGVRGHIDVLLKSESGKYIAMSCKYDKTGWAGMQGDRLIGGCKELGLTNYKLFACAGKSFKNGNNKQEQFDGILSEKDVSKVYSSIKDYLSKHNGVFTDHKIGLSPIVERDPGQRMFISKTTAHYVEDNECWWNVYCRFGKTPMSILMSEKLKSKATLFITPFPTNCLTDVKACLKNSLYHSDHNFIELNSETVAYCLENDVKNPFFFASTQFLVMTDKRVLKWLFEKYKIDFVIRDEAHRNDTGLLDEIKTLIKFDKWLNMTGTLDAQNLKTIAESGHPVVSMNYLDCLIIRNNGCHPTIPITQYLKEGENISDFYNEINFPNPHIYSLVIDEERFNKIIDKGYADHMVTPSKLIKHSEHGPQLINEIFGGMVVGDSERVFVPMDFATTFYKREKNPKTIGVYVNRTEDAQAFSDHFKTCTENPDFDYRKAVVEVYNTSENGEDLAENLSVINNRKTDQILVFTGQGRESTTITEMINTIIIGNTSAYVRLMQTLARNMNRLKRAELRSSLLVTTGMEFIESANNIMESETSNLGDIPLSEKRKVFFNCFLIHKMNGGKGLVAPMTPEDFIDMEAEVSSADMNKCVSHLVNEIGLDFSDLNLGECFAGDVGKVKKVLKKKFGKKSLGKDDREVSDTPRGDGDESSVDEEETDDNMEEDAAKQAAVLSSLTRSLIIAEAVKEYL